MLELNIQLQCKKNDTIEQLQMGVSTIATALAHTDFQGFYSGNLRWKMSVASGDIGNCTRKL